MDRRQFILSGCVTAGLTLAGCLSPPNEPTPSDDRPRVGKLSLNLPDGVTAYPNIKEPITHEQNPLQITFTLKNTSETEYQYGEARNARFIGAKDGNFFLYPLDSYSDLDDYQYNDEKNVWVATKRFAQTEEYRVETLATNSSVTQSLVLLHQYTDDTPIEYPDELRFAVEFSMATTEEGVLDEEIPCRIEFSVFPPKAEETNEADQ